MIARRGSIANEISKVLGLSLWLDIDWGELRHVSDEGTRQGRPSYLGCSGGLGGECVVQCFVALDQDF